MNLRIAAYMAAAAIFAKLTLFLIDLEQESMAMYTIFVNLMIVLVGSFFTVRQFKIVNPQADVKSQVKNGMKTTTLFALMLSVFVLVYYNFIDTHYFPDMINSRVEMAKVAMEENPDINIENVRRTGETMFSPTTHATITLFGLTAVGAVYTFFIVILMKKIPGFGK